MESFCADINLEGTAIRSLVILYDLIDNHLLMAKNRYRFQFFKPIQNYINIENLSRINNIVIVDVLGNNVLESQLNTGVNQINISALCEGVYFIHSIDEISEK